MLRTLTVCRGGLSVAAAVVLLTACGGSGDDTSASSGSSGTSSSASESSAGAADSEFCTQATAVQERVSSTFTSQSDPASLPQVLQQAADDIRGIKPPDEIASDWRTFADGIEQIATASRIDFNDPNAVATFQQQAGQLQQKFAPAFENVGNYLRDHCGIDSGSTGSASPSS
jgi:hypothetical protein